MRVTTTNVKPGDRVRGIGLVVTEVTPENDFWTRVEGTVSRRAEFGGYDVAETHVLLPNDHVVNVVRSDENFRADQVEAVQAALDEYNATGEGDDLDEVMGTLVEKLTAIANRPRHAYTTIGQVSDLYLSGELEGNESAEEVLTKLDELAQA